MPWNLSAVRQRQLGLAVVAGVGLVLVALHLLHATGENEGLRTFVYGIAFPAVFSIGVLLGAGVLWIRDVKGEYVVRVAGWVLFMALAFALGQGLTILYERAEGVLMSDAGFVMVNGASAGALVGLVVGTYDVRQRHQRQRSERLQAQLTVLNRVLRHDIRNGATVIKGRAELLMDGGTGREHAERIRSRATDLVSLGEQAREIERLQHATEAPRETVDIRERVEAIVSEMAARHPDAEFACDLSVEQPVSAHPLIESAIENVLQNAVDHSDRETPRIEVTADVKRDGVDPEVILRIADDGPGIPEAERTVLERGYESPLDHTSGLGLWLVNWIVRASGGRVWFEANEPRGSVVSLSLEPAETEEPTI